LICSAFITLDGVMEAPGGEEHRDGRNSWALRSHDPELQQWGLRQVLAADAILLGRTTYQLWAAFWPTAPESEIKRRLTDMPKYVISHTLQRADWSNTTVLSGDPATEVDALKARDGGELIVYGSADLVNTLMAHDLIDEYRLHVFPVVLGSGKHLFFDRIAMHHLRLVGTRTFPSGVVLLTYLKEAQEPTSPYVEEYTWTDEQARSLQAAQSVDRVLATVLFTDIVGSTARAAEIGDRAWRQLVDRQYEISRAEVDRWMGQHVENKGDGIMATFDTPSRALHCAFDIQRALTHLDLRIRVGLHCGEIELRETGYGGIGVHIAARVMGQAEPGQVLVTRTVRDLTSGTSASFRPIGSFNLKGVPGDWELLEASLPTASSRATR
jgi:class 3 adenylate cyclase/dihydrofolate reductase